MTRLIHMANALGSAAEGEGAQERGKRVSQLNKQLRELMDLITHEEDCGIELFEQITNALTALKEIRYKKDEGTLTARSLPKLCDVSVPEEFVCPISSELMRDPVIVASGQTYERTYIEAWLQEGHRTCPRTQQVLHHLILTPNNLVRSMISQWCLTKGLDPPADETASKPRSPCTITPQDRQHVKHLLDKISKGQEGTREATLELRLLTKKKPSYRIFLRDAVPMLVPLLSSSDSETQEHAVTTLLNISIHDPNKTLVASHEEAIPSIIKVIEQGTAEAKGNAAATLFSLSAVDDNKAKIGATPGAIPALVSLLQQGSAMAKKDSASALFNLCIHHSNRTLCFKAGMIPALLNLIADEKEKLLEESLAILAMVASHPEAAIAMESSGALPCLMHIIKGHGFNPRTKENAIVILHAICSCDRSYLKELRSDEIDYNSVVELSENGTSRAQRKASALLDRMRRRTERLPTM